MSAAIWGLPWPKVVSWAFSSPSSVRIRFGSFTFSGTRPETDFSAKDANSLCKGARRAISNRPDIDTLRDQGALFLVFEPGRCPRSDQVEQAIEGTAKVSVSNRPVNESADGYAWLELLIEGLTFDLKGLDQPISVKATKFQHSIGISLPEVDDAYQALILLPGPHLAGGQSQLPIFRAHMALGANIGALLPGLRAFGWLESETLISGDRFAELIDQWLQGGALPVPGLIALRNTMDGGLQSVGLSFFTGQELRIEPEQWIDPDNARRQAVRLIQQLVLSGKLETTEQIIGPDGNPLRLEPSSNEKFVRVWRD